MFGEYLKEIRNLKGYSQAQLSELSGVKREYISKIENDKVLPPSEDVLFLLARALEEDPYFLILQAGKVPTDFQKVILKDKELFRQIRSKLEKLK